MNWVLLTVTIIFLLGIIIGICRGAVRIAVSLLTTLITIVVVVFATPYVAKAITSFTPLDEMIVSTVNSAMVNVVEEEAAEAVEGMLTEENVRSVLNAAGVSDETLETYGIAIEDIVNGKITSEALSQLGISSSVLDGLKEDTDQVVEEVIEEAEIPRDMQIAAIENADVPQVFKDLLTTNNNNDMYEELGVSTFGQYVGSFLARIVIHIVAFILTFIIITIILRAIVFALDIVSMLPVLGAVNRIAGAVIGGVIALIFIWLLFLVLTLLYTTSIGKEGYELIQSQPILQLLYDYNPVMRLATKM